MVSFTSLKQRHKLLFLCGLFICQTVFCKGQQKLVNFAGVESSEPSKILVPENLGQLQDIILRAKDEGLTPLVPLGALHSWSRVFKQDYGSAIDMSLLVEDPKFNEDNTVTASANMSIGALHKFLKSKERALPYSPMAMTATLVGLTATGSHGSHYQEGHFFELLTEFKLVDGLGQLVKIDHQGLWIYSNYLDAYELCQKGEDVLRIARKHLGCLGVVYEMTIRTVPAFDLQMDQTIEKEEEVFEDELKRFKQHFDRNYSADIMWFPRLSKMIMRAFNPSHKKHVPFNKKDRRKKKFRSKSAKFSFRLVTAIPMLASFSSRMALNTFKPMVRVGESQKIGNYLPSEPVENSRLQDMEYALPYQYADQVIKIIQENSKDYSNPLPIYIRRCGDLLYVEFLWLDGFKKGEITARKLESDFVKHFGAMAMPHDGKKYFINPWKRKGLAYKQAFARLRKHLDPSDLFLTDYKQDYFNGLVP